MNLYDSAQADNVGITKDMHLLFSIFPYCKKKYFEETFAVKICLYPNECGLALKLL